MSVCNSCNANKLRAAPGLYCPLAVLSPSRRPGPPETAKNLPEAKAWPDQEFHAFCLPWEPQFHKRNRPWKPGRVMGASP